MAALPPLDATSVIATAKHLIISSNYLQVENARATVFATLEQYANDTSSIALWLAFAELEMELRQFKQATKVFELAVAKWPSSIELWKRYISFCLDREKFSNAKKLVLRALDTTNKPTEHEALWDLLRACPATLGDVPALQSQRTADGAPATAVASSTPTAVSPAIEAPITAATEPTKVVPVAAAVSDASSKFATTPVSPAVPEPLFFKDIPMTMPVFPDCEYLLFDPVDPSVTVPTPVLQMLSELLRDNNEHIFNSVFDMASSQRKQDLATLYRWQDLVALQMKEGSDLCQRHHAADENTAPRELIEQQTQFLQQRDEFTGRCAKAQQQFIDVQGLTRKTTLATQQRALQELRIPLMVVTEDPAMIAQQRKMTLLILEAEAVWRAQHPRVPAPVPAKPAPVERPRHEHKPEAPTRFQPREEPRFQPRRTEPPPARQPPSFSKPQYHAPRQDFGRQEPPRQEPPRQEYGRQEPLRQEYGRSHEPPRQDFGRPEYPARQDFGRQEPPRQDFG
ncbi:hypothetical protein ACHHYP_16423, partial [Achlya hypogyna]